jgi:acid phosphatase
MTSPAVRQDAPPAAAALPPASPSAPQIRNVSPGLAFAGMISRGLDGNPAYVYSEDGQWEVVRNSTTSPIVGFVPLKDLPEYRLVTTGNGTEWQLLGTQAFFERQSRAASPPSEHPDRGHGWPPAKFDGRYLLDVEGAPIGAVTKVNNVPVNDIADIESKIAAYQPGTLVQFSVMHNDREIVVPRTVGALDRSSAPFSHHACAVSVIQQPDGKASVQPQVTCFRDVQNLGLLKKEVTQYFQSPGYQRDVRKVTNEAMTYMKARADQIKAGGGKIGDFGIVLDIDETSLFNIDHMEKVDYGYIDKDEKAWEQGGRAKAIGPTLQLYQAARALGLKVFFVTGRKDGRDERNATISNLWRAGYAAGWQKLIMVQPGKKYDTVADYKGLERQKIEEQGCHILFTLGDQWSDLAPSKLGDGKEHAEQAYKLPNPAYFIP